MPCISIAEYTHIKCDCHLCLAASLCLYNVSPHYNSLHVSNDPAGVMHNETSVSASVSSFKACKECLDIICHSSFMHASYHKPEPVKPASSSCRLITIC